MAPPFVERPSKHVVSQLPEAEISSDDARSKIYCGGPLLEAVQNSRLFRDCKHFVDMPLKYDAG